METKEKATNCRIRLGDWVVVVVVVVVLSSLGTQTETSQM